MMAKSEKKKLRQFNPLDVTESLGYTTFRRDSRKPWSKEEDTKLSELINNKLVEQGYANGIHSLNAENIDYARSLEIIQELDWDEIGDLLQTRRGKDCRKRWTNSLDPNLKKGKWTAEEDDKLIASFQKHGSSWQKISLEIPGRTDDQCAKRYIEVLDPNTKDRLRPWSLEEDLSLIRKVKVYGTKWRTISLEMRSRPSLTCRNRWRKVVTDVVRGKADPKVKKEIDSFEGGLSKIEEISETLQFTKVGKQTKGKRSKLKTESDIEEDDKLNELPPTLSSALPVYPPRTQTHEPVFPQASLSNDQSGPYVPITESRVRPSVNTEMDWKFTLKDTSGLTISNGNISTTELAKQLIENAKKYDLKVSIHQHIHHHYNSNNQLTGKITSPGDSSSNLSGHAPGNPNDEIATPNRYSHFNYLPPMVQPQLESSSFMAREHDLSRLLNPSAAVAQGISANASSHIGHPSNHEKRRMSNSSGNNRKKRTLSNDMNYEDLEDELDFWETMRSLSHFNNQSTGSPAPITTDSKKQQQRHHNRHQNEGHDKVKLGLYYTTEQAENVDMDPEELEENFRDLNGFSGLLPFNPS